MLFFSNSPQPIAIPNLHAVIYEVSGEFAPQYMGVAGTFGGGEYIKTIIKT